MADKQFKLGQLKKIFLLCNIKKCQLLNSPTIDYPVVCDRGSSLNSFKPTEETNRPWKSKKCYLSRETILF